MPAGYQHGRGRAEISTNPPRRRACGKLFLSKPVPANTPQPTIRVPLRGTLGTIPVLTGNMVNKTYRRHGEQLFKGNVGRQQCFHALERNSCHGSTYEIHLGMERSSGIEDRAMPLLRQIQRRIGYKWVQRYLRDGPAGLADRSRAPLHHPQKLSPSGSPAFSKSALGTRYMARPKFAPYSGANSLNNTLPHRQPSANFFVTKGSPGLGKNAAGHHHTAGLWHTRSSPMTSYRSTSRAGSCAAMARASTRSPWSITPAATCSAAKA